MKARKETHTRSRFAYEKAEYWAKKLPHYFEENGGNILSCKPMIKIAQARRIYIHYVNEYQKGFGLKLMKN